MEHQISKGNVAVVFMLLIILALVVAAVVMLDLGRILITPSGEARRILCTDIDGGINYYLAGIVSDATGIYSDYCSSSTTLVEYYCGKRFSAASIFYTCANGCFSGACKGLISNGLVCTNDAQCSSGNCATDISGTSSICCQSGYCDLSGTCVANGYEILTQKCNNGDWQPLGVIILKFSDDFSSYSTGTCLSDGATFGQWKLVFNGFGCTQIETDGANKWLHESPKASTSSSETHASLVTGPSFSNPITFEIKSTPISQLRSGTPNPWEVAWVIWHYTDNTHFYYFIAKTNGWELGKEDPAYPGNQRYLATGSSPKYVIGTSYTIKVTQDSSNKITVFVNGAQVVSFTDTERPYTSGKIGLYNEDAHVHFDDVKVS